MNKDTDRKRIKDHDGRLVAKYVSAPGYRCSLGSNPNISPKSLNGDKMEIYWKYVERDPRFLAVVLSPSSSSQLLHPVYSLY
jgi:hypothetical protein